MRRTGPLIVCLSCLAGPAAADESSVIDEVLAILHERGIVDTSRYSELVSKNESYEKKQESLLGRIEFSGDLRTRLESFWYDDTALDENRDNRTRMRYRLRFQGRAEINDYTEAVFRLAAGESEFDGFPIGDLRSTNRTLGRDPDFGNDEIFIDLAYIQLKAPESWIGGENSRLEMAMGKTRNPFRWKNGKDYLLWDEDITPEGVGAQFNYEATASTDLFLNAGYFIVKENSTRKDPHVFGLQGGAEVDVSELVKIGGRLSFYNWRSLDTRFFLRSAAVGSIPDGLSDDGMSNGELAAYLRYTGIANWPILGYGHYARNFDAERSDLFPAANKEDTGWGVSLEAGDKKKYAMLGIGYYWAEANFWPAQFTDSDLFDGRTNRRGWTFYGSRRVLPNTDLNITLFASEPIRQSLPRTSVALSERLRLQTDLVVKF